LKIQLKKQSTNEYGAKRWDSVEINELLGMSVNGYMLQATSPTMCAVYKEDKPVLFISNDDTALEQYKEKGVTLNCKTIKELLGTEIAPKIIAEIFPNSKFIEIQEGLDFGGKT